MLVATHATENKKVRIILTSETTSCQLSSLLFYSRMDLLGGVYKGGGGGAHLLNASIPDKFQFVSQKVIIKL
jgi:hypothetical protein